MQVVIPDTPDEPHVASQRRRVRTRTLLLALFALFAVLVYFAWREPTPQAAMQEKPPAFARDTETVSETPLAYRLMVGGFADQSQASRAARRLRVDGWRVEVLAPAQSPDSQFTVQVGPLSDRSSAEEAARAVRSATGAPVTIVPLR